MVKQQSRARSTIRSERDRRQICFIPTQDASHFKLRARILFFTRRAKPVSVRFEQVCIFDVRWTLNVSEFRPVPIPQRPSSAHTTSARPPSCIFPSLGRVVYSRAVTPDNRNARPPNRFVESTSSAGGRPYPVRRTCRQTDGRAAEVGRRRGKEIVGRRCRRSVRRAALLFRQLSTIRTRVVSGPCDRPVVFALLFAITADRPERVRTRPNDNWRVIDSYSI